MKLSQAAFVYPRIELPYIKDWLDHHEAQGVDHVYMTLHLNEPFDKHPGEEKIKWKKKMNAPYFMDGTELELLEKLKESIKSHIERGRITINLVGRNIDCRTDTDLGEHIIAQCDSYEWARQKIIERQDPDWDWILVCDIDEFFLPICGKSIKEIISQEPENISSFRCSCVIHPSRHDFPLGELPWNTYTQNVGLDLSSSKYAASARKTNSFSMHWSYPKDGYNTKFNPDFYIHHFCGFNKNTVLDNLIHGWPPENRSFFTKNPNEPFELKGHLCNRPRKGPC